MLKKHFTKSNIHFWFKANKTKPLNKPGLGENILNLIKDIYGNPISNIILNGEDRALFP